MRRIANNDIKYIIVSTVRNEEEFIGRTVNAVLSQTIQPQEWVIVNDGSTDRTSKIIMKQTYGCSWARVITRGDRGYSRRGDGVVGAFYAGYASLSASDFEYIVKLDGDVMFDPDFFERLLSKFEVMPNLGIASGYGYEMRDNRLVKMRVSRDSAFGATRVYRRQCFEEIGGLVRAWGWDGIDEVKAEMAGWKVISFEDVSFLHLKPHVIRNKVEHGRSAFVKGSHPIYVLARGIWRMQDRPYAIAGMALLWGFFSSYFRGIGRIEDTEFRKYLRRKQLGRVFQILRLKGASEKK